MVVVFGHAGSAPDKVAVAGLISAVSCAFVYSPSAPALSYSTLRDVPPVTDVEPTAMLPATPPDGIAQVPSDEHVLDILAGGQAPHGAMGHAGGVSGIAAQRPHQEHTE